MFSTITSYILLDYLLFIISVMNNKIFSLILGKLELICYNINDPNS